MPKIVKYFNFFVEKTLFKIIDKTNKFFSHHSKISNFNKFIIAFISLLFVYLFYLSIPNLYDKAWLQSNIEKKLLNEYKIKFSTSSDISYKILPKPHFLIRDSKIFNRDSKKESRLAEIKNLKIFIDQSNFFNREKISINKLIIDKANFSLLMNDFRFLNNATNKKFSNKKIKINKSNIFFKDLTNETIAIIKISKAYLFFDEKKLFNLFNLDGEVFNIPFNFDLNKKIFSSENKKINIRAKSLKLEILNEFNSVDENYIDGLNIFSNLNSKIYTKYNIDNNVINFETNNSKINNSNISFIGRLSFNPFDLNLDINLEKYQLSKLFDTDSIFLEFIKTKLLFNENISINSTIISSSNARDEIFNSSKINLNIINGILNLDKTELINKDIGLIKLDNSNVFFENDKLIMNTDIMIEIKDPKNLFSFLQTPKKSRKVIKNIFLNLNYDFSNKEINFKNLKIDKKEPDKEILTILQGFNNNKVNNLNKGRRLINELFNIYEG